MNVDELPDRMADWLSDSGIVIFLFHGVVERQRHRVRNYNSKHLERDLFARCIRRVAALGHAVSMDEVLAACEGATSLPPRAFAVTFDDGFENNLSIAAPVLADFGIPATIYVTSRFVEENAMSWIDRIEYVVEDAPAQTLALDWADAPFMLSDAASRVALLKAVRQHVKNNRDCDANAFADRLCARLGKSEARASDDPLDRKLNWDQIRRARDSGLVSFGGHSHTHSILSFLDRDRLAYELDTSLQLLRRNAGVGPTHYSYPEGLEHCFSPTVIAALKSRGVRCCPTAIAGVNRAGADPFHLRRVMIGPIS